MCGPAGSLLTGAAASGGNAATSGLFGTAGEFALGNTLSTLGTVAGGVGSIVAGQAAADASKDIAASESELLKKEAALIEKQGAFDVAQREEEARRLKSRQIVSAAGSGVKRTGSVLEVMNEAARIAEEEAFQIDYAAGQSASSKLFEASETVKAANKAASNTKLTSGLSGLSQLGGLF